MSVGTELESLDIQAVQHLPVSEAVPVVVVDESRLLERATSRAVARE